MGVLCGSVASLAQTIKLVTTWIPQFYNQKNYNFRIEKTQNGSRHEVKTQWVDHQAADEGGVTVNWSDFCDNKREKISKRVAWNISLLDGFNQSDSWRCWSRAGSRVRIQVSSSIQFWRIFVKKVTNTDIQHTIFVNLYKAKVPVLYDWLWD